MRNAIAKTTYKCIADCVVTAEGPRRSSELSRFRTPESTRAAAVALRVANDNRVQSWTPRPTPCRMTADRRHGRIGSHYAACEPEDRPRCLSLAEVLRRRLAAYDHGVSARPQALPVKRGKLSRHDNLRASARETHAKYLLHAIELLHVFERLLSYRVDE